MFYIQNGLESDGTPNIVSYSNATQHLAPHI